MKLLLSRARPSVLRCWIFRGSPRKVAPAETSVACRLLCRITFGDLDAFVSKRCQMVHLG